ncbi:hypothetical protein [Legionella quinlivanii]|uniref:hypothetical protein n=1 Tax=Legionella quinlivanii TaxID=45073 RepID=UPI002244386F|nr:hypothetical protein [Legionella quinlivanii]MCW8451788.1 hypothetical protein [Legionella quinlivanii]
MSFKTFKTQKNSFKINDTLIRHIISHSYDYSVGKPTDNAFPIKQLSGSGLSVSIERLLTSQLQPIIIANLAKGNHSYVCDYMANINNIYNILDDAHSRAFKLQHTPDIINPAHAEIKFSSTITNASDPEKRKYRKKLKQIFFKK